MNIGEKIKKRRLELEWSQRELAKRMGYTNNSTIVKIEQGKVDVSQSRLEQFCKVLGVNVLYFLSDEHIDKDDAEFIEGLGYVHPKETTTPEIEAINTLLYSYGCQIIKTNGNYFFGEAGMLSEDELNDFLNNVITMVHSSADALIKKKTNQIKNYLAKKE